MRSQGDAADAQPRQAFINNLLEGKDAHWQLCDGISACQQPIGDKPGLALRVQLHALGTRQLQQVLERRYEHALAYDGLFIFLDAERALVIWQALLELSQAQSLERALSRALSLAGLDEFDEPFTGF